MSIVVVVGASVVVVVTLGVAVVVVVVPTDCDDAVVVAAEQNANDGLRLHAICSQLIGGPPSSPLSNCRRMRYASLNVDAHSNRNT